MTTRTQELGLLGERVAARWLQRQGWRIVDHRWRSGRRDLDLVAVREATVAFVEVKARRGTWCGGPVAAVGWRKQRELTRSAQAWLEQRGPVAAPGATTLRFDVVGVVVADRAVRVAHIPDAFAAHRASG